MLPLIFFPSLPPLPEDLRPRIMPQDYLAWWLLVVPSPPGRAAAPVSTVLPAAREPWPVHRTCYLVPDLLFFVCLSLSWGTDLLHPLQPLWLFFIIVLNLHLLWKLWVDRHFSCLGYRLQDKLYSTNCTNITNLASPHPNKLQNVNKLSFNIMRFYINGYVVANLVTMVICV